MRDKIGCSVPIRSPARPLSNVFMFISCHMHILISATIPVPYDEQLFSRGKGPFHRITANHTSRTPHHGGPHGRLSVKLLYFVWCRLTFRPFSVAFSSFCPLLSSIFSPFFASQLALFTPSFVYLYRK